MHTVGGDDPLALMTGTDMFALIFYLSSSIKASDWNKRIIIVVRFGVGQVQWCVPGDNNVRQQNVNPDLFYTNVLPIRLPVSDPAMGTFRPTLHELIVDSGPTTNGNLIALAAMLNTKWNSNWPLDMEWDASRSVSFLTTTGLRTYSEGAIVSQWQPARDAFAQPFRLVVSSTPNANPNVSVVLSPKPGLCFSTPVDNVAFPYMTLNAAPTQRNHLLGTTWAMVYSTTQPLVDIPRTRPP